MNFLETGSQGISPDWRGMLHSFVVYAEDDQGTIGKIREPLRCMLDETVRSVRRGPKAVQKIPGSVAFSDAASGQADKLRTNDSIACEVDVAADGLYEGVLHFRSARDDVHRFFVLVDGELAATVRCPAAKNYNARESAPVRIRLTAGRHRMVFVPVGFIFAGPMEFKAAVEDGK